MCSVFIIHLYSRYKSHSVLARRCVVAFYFCATVIQFSSTNSLLRAPPSPPPPTLPRATLPQMSEAGGWWSTVWFDRGRGKWWWWWADDGGREKTSGWVNGGGGFGDGWRGGRVVWSRQQYRASRWNEPKDPLFSFYLCVCVCLDGGLYCLVCLIVLFCFVLFCWVGWLCACFIYYLFTAHSLFTRYSKKLIPQWVFQSKQENRMSYSLAEWRDGKWA